MPSVLVNTAKDFSKMVKTTDTPQEYMLASTPFVGDASHFNFSHFGDCVCITLVLIAFF